MLSAWADLFYLRYVKRFFGENIAFKASFCRLTSWFTIYMSSRSLTNSLEEVFTIICLSLMRADDTPGLKKKDNATKSARNQYWLFHAVAFTSFVVRSTAAINLIPIYVYHFFFLCSSSNSKIRFFVQFVLTGLVLSE